MTIAQVEDFIIRARKPLLIVFAVITALMIWQITGLKAETSLEKMVPLQHPYIQNLLKHKDELGLGNDIKIAVSLRKGDIFDAEYLELVKNVTDDVFYFPGVDRAKLKSLWTPTVRWSEVTKDGFQGGEVTQGYDGTPEGMDALRSNILRSGQVGRLVADDFKSTIIQIPLLEGEKIDYKVLSAKLEEVRSKYEAKNPNVDIHIIGFAKKVGDLIEGAAKIAFFFLAAAIITFFLLVWDFRDLKSAAVIVFCSIVAVVWQLGIVKMLGFGLDPYSMLVPFVVFAIAVSHSVQIVNAITIEMANGADAESAVKKSILSLFKAGSLALSTDIIGFLTLLIIDVDVIKALAISASIGTAMIAFTNFVMLPIIMSYVSMGQPAIRKVQESRHHVPALWTLLSRMTNRLPATFGVIFAIAMMAFAGIVSQNVKIGDLDRGAPELHPDSRYNLDDLFVTSNYSISADVLVVMVESEPQMCASYPVLEAVDRLQWHLENVPGVQSAASLVTAVKRIQTGFNEGNLKWSTLVDDDQILNESARNVPELYNGECSLVPVFVFLDDHKAETLTRVTDAVKSFAAKNDSPDVKFLLASGNAGIEAATNDELRAKKTQLVLLVYGVVIAICFIAFRSWRPVVCIILPLVITSMLCEALMAMLGIGIKVATLPVIALGVGIGVDYGLYIFSKLEHFLKEGKALQEAYLETLRSTGKAVMFTGVTLAIGVCTWVFSPIKFQADMGLLLTAMLLWNMVGALVLIPALASFLIKPERYRA
ncbi:MAG: MMPL family transporter [Moraxellaceae bacterium]|nr:MMPL family transporter [Moraxellaceae bacterium]